MSLRSVRVGLVFLFPLVLMGCGGSPTPNASLVGTWVGTPSPGVSSSGSPQTYAVKLVVSATQYSYALTCTIGSNSATATLVSPYTLAGNQITLTQDASDSKPINATDVCSSSLYANTKLSFSISGNTLTESVGDTTILTLTRSN